MSPPASAAHASSTQTEDHPPQQAKARRSAKGAEPFEKWEKDEMEKLLGELNGHLGWCLL